MSRPFTNISSANRAFGGFKEPKDAGNYIYNKKARATYCVANKCAPSIKVDSQSHRLLFNKSNQLSLYPCANGINTANLNINLVTRLNLSGVSVIQDASSGAVPSTITLDSIPFLDYVIDPSGELFGNSVCGINNFIQLLTPNTQPSPYIIISGIYEITSDFTYNTIITFYGNSVIEFTKSINIDYIIVGGGGGGGYSGSIKGGGGGGGQVLTGFFNTEFETFDITIGKGGNGATNSSAVQNGSNSSIISMTTTITAAGGLGSTGFNGGNSGAGGAGGIYYDLSVNPPPSYVNGTNGGGGAAGSGQPVSAGNGGLNSVNPNYGGGGGGGSGNGFIPGGIGVGGGGNGGNQTNPPSPAQNGSPNTGGGGGGGALLSMPIGGNGGSGVVIFSFNV